MRATPLVFTGQTTGEIPGEYQFFFAPGGPEGLAGGAKDTDNGGSSRGGDMHGRGIDSNK